MKILVDPVPGSNLIVYSDTDDTTNGLQCVNHTPFGEARIDYSWKAQFL